MADRCFVKIIIGGNIPRSLVRELATRLLAERLADIDSGGSALETTAEIEDALTFANGQGTVGFEASEVSGGQFTELKGFLIEHKIHFKEISRSLTGVWDGEMVAYNPHLEPPIRHFHVNQNDDPLILRFLLKKAHGASQTSVFSRGMN